MPAPTETEYTLDAKIAANTSLLDLIDGWATNAQIKIYDDADTLLAVVVLDDPAGVVDPGTGQLTLSILNGDPSANADGLAAYASITDGNNTPYVSMPAVEGTAAVYGYIVFNSLTIVQSSAVNIVSAVIG